MNDLRSRIVAVLIVLWMALMTVLFALVMLPPDSGVAQRLPAPIAAVQSYVYGQFHSPSTLW